MDFKRRHCLGKNKYLLFGFLVVQWRSLPGEQKRHLLLIRDRVGGCLKLSPKGRNTTTETAPELECHLRKQTTEWFCMPVMLHLSVLLSSSKAQTDISTVPVPSAHDFS